MNHLFVLANFSTEAGMTIKSPGGQDERYNISNPNWDYPQSFAG